MELRKAYSADVKIQKKSSKMLIELKNYLKSLPNWTFGIESTKIVYVKSKTIRGISISITVDYDLVQNVDIDHRIVTLIKTNVNKPNNRVLKPEELGAVNKVINQVRNFLS